MIRLLLEAFSGLKAVMRAAAFRDDWERHLNLSASGFLRSFSAALLVLPVFWFILQGTTRLFTELSPGFENTYTGSDFLVDLVRIWLVFPVLAALLTRIAGVKHRFVHWVILHNWAVLFLFLIQGLIFLFYLAGLSSASVTYSLLTSGYLVFRFFLHARMAIATLGLPVGMGIVMGLIPVIVDFAIIELTR